MTPDTSAKNALLDAKTILVHGKFHLRSGHLSRLDKLLAIHHAHHAIELTLREKALQLGENPWNFPEILKALKRHEIAIPYERELAELNTVRNLMQHYGAAAEDKDVHRLVTASENFMRDFCQNCFDLSYDELSMADMIENDDAREALQRGYREFRAGQFWESAAYARLSIEQLKLLIETRIGLNKYHDDIPEDEPMKEHIEQLWTAAQ